MALITGAFFSKITRLLSFHKPPAPKEKVLTKSKFLSGLKCTNLLLYSGNPEIVRHRSENEWEGNFVQVEQIRNLARTLFPEGQSVRYSNSRKDLVEKTRSVMKNNKPIFNAAFCSDSFFTNTDIISPSREKGGWDLFLAKSSPAIKKYHTPDIAFQKMVATLSGIKINDCFIIYVNPDYIFQGEIDPELFFLKKRVTEKVDSILREIERTAHQYSNLLNGEAFSGIVSKCKSPSECQMVEACWKDLGDGDVFSLREGYNIPARLLQDGIRNLRDIPADTELSFKQSVQVNSEKTGTLHIQQENIKSFLEKLKYPFYFLDFETINPALPLYKNSWPYQHIPFQYSLHIQRDEFSSPEYYFYLEESSDDPRLDILETLRKLISDEGSIVVYDDFFEKRCLREATEIYPEYSEWLFQILGNFADISEPFKSFSYYHPGQKGSASLKAVLPVLTGLSYKDLPIKSGGNANTEFLKLKIDPGSFSSDAKEKVRAALLEYSKLDTYALYAIVKELKKITV